MIVGDTNVGCGLMKASPSAFVLDWIQGQRPTNLFTTSITVAEILYGLERLSKDQRKYMLRAAAMGVFSAFDDHALPFGQEAAAVYAPLVHRRDQRELPIGGFDARIAAICGTHHATLATRNFQDFEHTGITIVAPWNST